MEKVFLMKNLMTHKFIFGLLMAFVLALGVQGIAEAVQDPNLTATTTEQTVGGQITDVFSLSGLTLDAANERESVRITKSGGISLTGSFTDLSSVTLTENDDDLTDNANGTLMYRERGWY